MIHDDFHCKSIGLEKKNFPFTKLKIQQHCNLLQLKKSIDTNHSFAYMIKVSEKLIVISDSEMQMKLIANSK